MSEDEQEKDEKRGFKVSDRRRFSATGEPREDPKAEPQKTAAEEKTPAVEGEAPSPAADDPPPAQEHAVPPFEINFSTFVISLSTQALVHLGEIPDPMSQQIETNLDGAKQLIDILGMLQTKTSGNLDEGEAGLIENILYDLRLKYVERAKPSSAA